MGIAFFHFRTSADGLIAVRRESDYRFAMGM